MTMSSDPYYALVTGANRGIGSHVARQLAERGFHVFVGARNLSRGETLAAQIVTDGGAAEAVALDVTVPESVAEAAETVAQRSGRLDVLVNNAGGATGFTTPSMTSVDDLRSTFELNVFGVVAVTNAFVPLLKRSGAAHVINVSSMLGSLTAMADPGARWSDINVLSYRITKAALNAASIQYARELGSERIRVNAICPGLRDTGFGGGEPIPGAGDPAEGAAGIVALASDQSNSSGEFFNWDGTLNPW